MLDVIRRHGLIAFMLALGVVSLGDGVVRAWHGQAATSAGVALLMVAIVAEEVERRAMVRRTVALRAVRWTGFLGALAFLML